MGDKDISEKRLEEFPDVFADIANVLLFDGETVIQPDELENASPHFIYKAGSVLHEQITKFQSDFRFVAEYLKQMRVNRDYHPSKETVDHVQAVLDLLTALTEDNDLAKSLVNHTERSAEIMYEHLEKLKDKVRAEERIKAENQMGRLISFLLKNGKNDEIALAAENEAKRHELYLQYGIN